MPVSISQPTVYRAFREAVERWNGRPFLRAPASATAGYNASAVEYSYTTAKDAVEQLRTCYLALGLKAGDRVALAFDSRLEVYLHLLALNAQGASLVPLNMDSSDAELLHIIAHSESRWMSGTTEHRSRLQHLASINVSG